MMNNHKNALSVWYKKFAQALRGMKIAVLGEISFHIHLSVTAIVVVAGTWLGISPIHWSILILCIAVVLSAEMLNTAIEHIARAITKETQPEIRDALDIAAGAVFMASIGAAVVGFILLGWPLFSLMS